MGPIRRFAAWRRYRRMSRQLAQLDRADRRTERLADRGAPTRPKRGFPTRGEALFLVSIPLIAVLCYLLTYVFPGALGDPGIRRPDLATPGHYAFMQTTPNGRPVGYRPCQPIRYVVNPAGMPADGDRLIKDAIGVISATSGLKFVDDGRTEEGPSPHRPPDQTDRYGAGSAPVLIAWADHTQYPEIDGDIEGIGGSTSIEQYGPESAYYVTGQIVLSKDGLAEMLAEPNGYLKARAVVMHEVGHLVGLAHVNDRDEVMAPQFTGLVELGPGDRAGLALLGENRCRPGT
ncbi:MAG TPA: matrixin family metalloprotease [Pseudonocardia sp.]